LFTDCSQGSPVPGICRGQGDWRAPPQLRQRRGMSQGDRRLRRRDRRGAQPCWPACTAPRPTGCSAYRRRARLHGFTAIAVPPWRRRTTKTTSARTVYTTMLGNGPGRVHAYRPSFQDGRGSETWEAGSVRGRCARWVPATTPASVSTPWPCWVEAAVHAASQAAVAAGKQECDASDVLPERGDYRSDGKVR